MIGGVPNTVLQGNMGLNFNPICAMPSSIVLLQRDHEASPHLRSLLDAAAALCVVGVAHTVVRARELIACAKPDVLVTDMWVQDGEVSALLKELHQHASPRPHVLVTALAHDDAMLLSALRAGADGYWVHTSASELLVQTTQQLARGETVVSPMMARQILDGFGPPAPTSEDVCGNLNPREREILRWLAKGYLAEEVAHQWQTTLHSVASSVRQVVRKIQRDLQTPIRCGA
jgi:DNA-binding NarL/FixJ family response regulator